MHKQREICSVQGCGKASQGKQYCAKHMAIGERRKLSTELKALIRSACCQVKCIAGKAHENGEQYCTKCKEPCLWKTA